ncbi:TPA: GtrA family protein [Streptococcus agalactiae]
MVKLKSLLKKSIQNEVSLYLLFGLLTSLLYLVIRQGIFKQDAPFSAIVANIIAILFAFFTNDRFVFKQTKIEQLQRLQTFVIARLGTLGLDLILAVIFVDQFPSIIGQFVQHNLNKINTIESLVSQILIILLNYILSKFVIFKDKKRQL